MGRSMKNSPLKGDLVFLRIVMGVNCFTLAARYGANVEKKEDNVNYHARLQHTFRANAVRPGSRTDGALRFFTLALRRILPNEN